MNSRQNPFEKIVLYCPYPKAWVLVGTLLPQRLWRYLIGRCVRCGGTQNKPFYTEVNPSRFYSPFDGSVSDFCWVFDYAICPEDFHNE